MMKGIRGLLEKDFRLFFRQGGNLFLGVSVCSIVFYTYRKNGSCFHCNVYPICSGDIFR